MPAQIRDRMGTLKPCLSSLSLCSQKTNEDAKKIATRPYHSLRKRSKPKQRPSILDGWQGTPPGLSSASLISTSLNGSLLAEDFMWTSFQPNYINMMNDTNLMEECNEANLELESNISTRNPTRTYTNRRTGGGQKRKWSPDQLTDAPKLSQWITFMENYLLAVGPSFSEIRKMNEFELKTRLKEHVRIRQYIAVHSKCVSKLVKKCQEAQDENLMDIVDLENRYLCLLLKAIEIQCALEEFRDNDGLANPASSEDEQSTSEKSSVHRCHKKFMESTESMNQDGDISDVSDEQGALRRNGKISPLIDHKGGMQSSLTSFTYSSMSMLPSVDYPRTEVDNFLNSADLNTSSASSSESRNATIDRSDNNETVKNWLNRSDSDIDVDSTIGDVADLSWDDFQMMYPKSDSPMQPSSAAAAVQTCFEPENSQSASKPTVATDLSTIVDHDIFAKIDETLDSLTPNCFTEIAEVCRENVECLQNVLYGEVGKRWQQSKYLKLNIRQMKPNELLLGNGQSHEWCVVEKKCRCSNISNFLIRVVDFLLDFTNFIKKFTLYKCLLQLIRKLYDIISFVGGYVGFGKKKESLSPIVGLNSAIEIKTSEKMCAPIIIKEKTIEKTEDRTADLATARVVDISDVCQTNVDYLQKLLQTDVEIKLRHLNGFKLMIKKIDTNGSMSAESTHEICVIKTRCKCPLLFRSIIRCIDLLFDFMIRVKNFVLYTCYVYPVRKIFQLIRFVNIGIKFCKCKFYSKLFVTLLFV